MVLSENIYKLNQKAKHLKVQVVHNDRNAKKPTETYRKKFCNYVIPLQL